MSNESVRKHFDALLEILDRAEIDETERIFRKKQLIEAVNLEDEIEWFHGLDKFLQLAHEIETYAFLSQFGKIHMACDSKHEAGADFILNDEIYIECVCASLGDIKKSGIAKFISKDNLDGRLVDCNEERRLLNARLTNSLGSKVNFYNDHYGRTIPEDRPYIIFISVGRLAYNWFAEENGMALTDILLGRGRPTVVVGLQNDKLFSTGYEHVEQFEKFNGAPVCSNLFCEPQFSCVSGVLLATDIAERYNSENTFLFLNPFAKTKINPLIFTNIVYWNVYNGNKYCAWRDGVPQL